MCVWVCLCMFVRIMLIHKYLKMNFLYVFFSGCVSFFPLTKYTQFFLIFFRLYFAQFPNQYLRKQIDNFLFFCSHNNLLYVSLQVEQKKSFLPSLCTNCWENNVFFLFLFQLDLKIQRVWEKNQRRRRRRSSKSFYWRISIGRKL